MTDRNLEELYQAIYKRKSIRKYKEEKLNENELGGITDFLAQTRELYPEIKYEAKIVNSEAVKSLLPIKAPHYLQFFSEAKGDYLLNAGFILQQLDLYLSAENLGSCWFGMAKPKKEIIAESDLEYVITLVFGRPAEASQRDSIEDFDRKPLAEIKQGNQHYDLLEAARLAPSATNGQPWYFITESERIHLYQLEPNFIKKFFYEKMNRIDMGIALAHLWLAAEEHGQNFEFTKLDQSPAPVENYNYLGTVKL
ncbi:putative nitroreductase [Halanaerobium saccharolyticum]|uniref:Putative nitroreductase n=1 Tax=Halanaerobium saccharolyticum TaxID=43595 RepID=A0A4R7Z137_9FIRM|nr:nitroreductase family protein [Halanaerobium saccharolyticum]RAK08169.1 putative nitroreductase [Halanaerobium saccharolyticum]TDW04376.1 putative nitroreductase [Halanaerobium saccharolyticum]TDX59667.1 putative nitroreductase [Halanaerobium saccharolyticum]